jgi:hypothetical protein
MPLPVPKIIFCLPETYSRPVAGMSPTHHRSFRNASYLEATK